MFPFIILEVHYIRNKKSGKRSENIMGQKKIKSAALGTRSQDSGVRVQVQHY